MDFVSFRKNHYMYSYEKRASQNFPFHLHQYYEVLLFASGNATYVIDGTEYTANPGDVFITKSNELHSIFFTTDCIYERHFIQFDEDFINNFSDTLLEKFETSASIHKIDSNNAKKYKIDDFFNKINYYITNRPTEFEVMAQVYIIQMLVTICECLKSVHDKLQIPAKRIEKIKKYVNLNFTKNLSLDEIADNVFLNKYYMCHIFKEETGMTIKEYIELLRFTYAKKLHFEGKKITEISTLCGYSDYSLFYKNFTKFSDGKSPTDFFAKKTPK